jgi:uncharacterized protein with HEPN domain
MSKKKRIYLDFINDIKDEIQNIEEYVDSLSYEDFIRDGKTLRAVIKCFEIIGEAVKNIPTEIREKYPDIPWKDMAGMRDKLIHEYFGIDYEILWQTIKFRIPEIKPLFVLLSKQAGKE